MARLEGKVALITGAASGIGQKTAQLMAREGATVVLTDIRDIEGERAAAEIVDDGGAARYLALDVTKETDWETAIETVMDEAGQLDILVNNAGIPGAGIKL